MHGVQMTLELARILKIPRRVNPKYFDATEFYKRKNAQCSGCILCRGGEAKLLPVQSAMLIEAGLAKGLFASVGCGFGKTLVSLLLPKAMRSTRAVLLVKPSLKDQLLATDIPMYRKHFELPPIFTLAESRRDRFGLYVVAYSELSSVKKADCLVEIMPDLIISDESHLLRHRSAARVKRFIRYMSDNTQVKFAALSGTMTTRSVKDFAHLIHFALGENTPVPRIWSDLEEWASALDERVAKPMTPGKLMLLCNPGETPREGFKRRILDTEGVVTTEESSIGTSLELFGRDVKVPQVINDALGGLFDSWAWDGNEFEDGMALSRVARQLACGFFYRWDWPDNQPDYEWLEARNAWHKEVRQFLTYRSGQGMDSPLLLANAAQSGKWKSETWSDWREVKDRRPPPVVPIWLDDFLIRDVQSFSREMLTDGACIIWTEHQEMGETLGKRLTIPYFGAGSAERLTKVNAEKTPLIVCSIQAHSEGRNLQAFSRNIIVSPPGNGATVEQLISRTHRIGQTADDVLVGVYVHTTTYREAVVNAIRDARFIEATTGMRQKLTYANKVFNFEVDAQGENNHVFRNI